MVRGKQEVQPKTGMWDIYSYESLLELSWIQWCLVLKQNGYIIDFGRCGSYSLTEKVTNNYTEGKKKKSQVLLNKASYEPDFFMKWGQDVWRDFVWDADSDSKKDRPLVGRKDQEGNMITIIEIKPIHDRNNSIRIVKDRIKFLFANSGVYVNLVFPELFYEEVFPPPEWLLTPTGLPKKMKYKPKTFFEHLQTLM